MSAAAEPCIVTRLHGGLGNQLFEYAAGYALSRRLGVPLRVDTRGIGRPADRGLQLREFNLPLDEASEATIRRLTPQWGPWWKNKWILWSHRITPFRLRRWAKEESFDFDVRVLGLRPPVYLDGWWQSEKYFADCSDEVRKMFLKLDAPSPRVATLGAELAAAPQIAVHVRRGDYVENDDAAQFHGCASLDYYLQAVAWMRERLPGVPFCVFSDDPAWARENLRFDGPVRWIDAAPRHTTHEDFFLMGCCTHFIIANSSFSWWQAWLRDGPGQLVVAPRRWFLGHDVKPGDRFPGDWHLIDA